MNKFWWSVIMIAAIIIIAIIDIKTMPIWVVIVNVALGIVAAFAAFRNSYFTELWCNGNTQDFGSWISGSNPDGSTNINN